jgi:fido (protein-threonine AMPylation protein)
MGEGYEAFDDPYLYPGTAVLRNLLGIEDSRILEAAEVEMTALRAGRRFQLTWEDWRAVCKHSLSGELCFR